MILRPFGLAALALMAGVALSAQQSGTVRGFDHAKHAKVFATCTTCHVGATPAGGGRSFWPDPVSCAQCHDGVIERRAEWQPRDTARHSNLRFDHQTHAARVAAKGPVACVSCHIAEAAAWMTVQRAAVERCLSCHEIRVAHLAAPDSACGTCHRALAEAPSLVRADVVRFPKPPSHDGSGFQAKAGHGAAARAAGGGVAASCTTCHAKEFCLACHVDAPEQPVIAAMASDPRSTAIAARLAAPASHGAETFLARHGAAVRNDPQACSTCHTRESCLVCHAGAPRIAAALAASGPGRGVGAVITRHPPPSHGAAFADRHAGPAAAAPSGCAGCHVRADCLECHRPDAARAAGYHPAAFLERHPAAAYARESSCSDCHNAGAFCQSCHASAGLVARGALRSGYHDVSRFWLAGHGQAARQSLETCVSCHVERDCLTCHSSVGGRRFNPHGPGFDAARLKRKNPEMCSACHGNRIP